MTKYRIMRQTSYRLARGRQAMQLGDFEADSPTHALEKYFDMIVAKSIPRHKLNVPEKCVKNLGMGEYEIRPYVIIDVNERYKVNTS